MVFGLRGRVVFFATNNINKFNEARSILSTGKSKVLYHELSGKDASSPGMICGGTAEILLDYFKPSKEILNFARCWSDTANSGRSFYILTRLHGKDSSFQVLGHAVLLSDGSIIGSSCLSASDVDKLKPEMHNVSTSEVLPLGDDSVLVDRIRRPKTLFCFGAGHVAVPTAHLAAMVGFRVVVIDDRPKYASAERFPEADEVRVTKDFHHAFTGIEIDADSFVVVVTRGHQFDRAVLEQALKTPAGYIGMISSRRKREAIYDALMSQGVKKERLEEVHSPIGIDIGGETPEEIAVSIVAEMIKVRSQQAA